MFSFSPAPLTKPGLTLAVTLLAGLLVVALPITNAEPIRPIPLEIDYDHAKAALGKKLFHDPLLSLDQTVSCASCHDLTAGGHDLRPVSVGIMGREGTMAAPTVFNAVFNFRQFWNGRAADLKTQAAGPLQDPREMGMSPEEVERRLSAEEEYRRTFREIYGGNRIRFDDVLDALAEFQRALITPNSPFDRYLRGETPLPPQALQGYHTFKEIGCVTCHNGVNLGGNSFQKIGVVNPTEYHGGVADRYTVTGNPTDRHLFKVPTLRNIVLTAPYFHNGSCPSLPEALKQMAFHNLGVEIPREQEQNLLAFLRALTGEKPAILGEGSR